MKNHTAGAKQREGGQENSSQYFQSAFTLWSGTGSQRRPCHPKNENYFAERDKFGFNTRIKGLYSTSKRNVVLPALWK
jgi:hypothetical protein